MATLQELGLIMPLKGRDVQITDLRRKGMTRAWIANKFDLSLQRVDQILARAGCVNLFTGSKAERNERDERIISARAAGVKVKDIAAQEELSVIRVFQILRKAK